MKIVNFLIATSLLVIFQFHFVIAQDAKDDRPFKITGKTRMPVAIGLPNEKSVEYAKESSDHLIVSVSNKDNSLINRKCYLFKGKKFDLSKERQYLVEKELILDGIQSNYRENGSIEKELYFQNGFLLKEIGYFPDGNKHYLFSGDEKILNGEYKIWFPNGQLNYSGAYKNNRKDGEFHMFDQKGSMVKQGVYQEGKLVAGEAVVHEIVYDNPEKPAVFNHGEETLDAYMKHKSLEMERLINIETGKHIDLKFIIDKTGKVANIESFSKLSDEEMRLLNSFFGEMPEYKPATVEDVPVASTLILKLILSNEGLAIRPDSQYFTNQSKEFPEFPGGQNMLKSYLSTNLRYPIEAAKKKIQGKVFVAYTVTEDGIITNVKVVRGIDMYLDAEAVRVIKNMPKWTPGKIDGKPVRVSLTAPINFILQ